MARPASRFIQNWVKRPRERTFLGRRETFLSPDRENSKDQKSLEPTWFSYAFAKHMKQVFQLSHLFEIGNQKLQAEIHNPAQYI
jgi:hypothetical protein